MYIVITGGGKVGEYLAQVLLETGHSVAIIEHNKQTADYLSSTLTGDLLVIAGDGSDSKYQEDAGIRHTDLFVATAGQDENNLVACKIAKKVFGVSRCVARVNTPKNLKIFRKLGIECISSTELIATLIENASIMGSINTMFNLGDAGIALIEARVPRKKYTATGRVMKSSPVLVGMLELPKDARVVSLFTTDGKVNIANDNSPVYPGDRLSIACKEEDIGIIKKWIHLLEI